MRDISMAFNGIFRNRLIGGTYQIFLAYVRILKWPLNIKQLQLHGFTSALDNWDWLLQVEPMSSPTGSCMRRIMMDHTSHLAHLAWGRWEYCPLWVKIWLVVWNIWMIFHILGIIWNNTPNWLSHIFQRGRYTTSQKWSTPQNGLPATRDDKPCAGPPVPQYFFAYFSAEKSWNAILQSNTYSRFFMIAHCHDFSGLAKWSLV